MIAKMPTIAAMAYKYSIGQPFIYPRNDLDYSSNFLHMCFAVPCEEYKIDPVLVRAIRRIFILHADHEQNASTSTVRLTGSSGANPFACISAGIACLWGPAHGGANEAALEMLMEIGTVTASRNTSSAPRSERSFPTDGLRPPGVQELRSRAKIMQKTCHEVLKAVRHADDPIFQVALELERIALHDDYFIEKKLYPNIDFYSGITLKALGFPTDMFTVLFAIARTVGWIAQWKEMIEDSSQRIDGHASSIPARPSAPTSRFRPVRLEFAFSRLRDGKAWQRGHLTLLMGHALGRPHSRVASRLSQATPNVRAGHRTSRQSARDHGDPEGTRLQLRNRESLPTGVKMTVVETLPPEPSLLKFMLSAVCPASTGNPRKSCIPIMQACYSRRCWSAWMPRLRLRPYC